MTAPRPEVAPAAPPDQIDDPIFFVPERAQLKVKAAARARNARLVSLGISVAVTIALYVFFRDQLGGMTWPVLVIAVAIPLALLAWTVGREVLARREARGVQEGLALGVARRGLLTGAGLVAWADVAGIAAVSRLGRGPDLVVTARDGRTAVLALDYLSAKPATIDASIKALSNGRCRIDFSKLDA